MVSRTTKLRWRRRMRQRKRQVEGLGVQAEVSAEQHFFKRLTKLFGVRRFVMSWLLLLGLLIVGVVFQLRALDDYYLVLKPAPGGIYAEAMVGAFTNANPLYATSSADSAAARLVFAGLMKYDSENNLTYDLAERMEVDETAKIYTFTLRPNLKWHDGQPLTSEDVVFTYRTIQNPVAKSPLRINWQGVSIKSQGAHTVVFTLPNTLSAFPHSLTNGIVPMHLLESVEPAQLRSILFNTVDPVGSGPFRWDAIEIKGARPENREEQIRLTPFEDYHGGAPKLRSFVLRIFRDEKELIKRFEDHEINAIAGLENLPEELDSSTDLHEYNIPLTSQVMVFFKTTEEPFNDKKVRQALVRSINKPAVVDELGFPVIVSHSPFLPGHVGYARDLHQLPFDIEASNKLLDEAGWKTGEDGIRQKGARRLSFRLYTKSSSEYTHVSQQLQEQWAAVGAEVDVILQNSSDLQTTVAQHSYEALLYGISLGADPDVFAYWHSNQATPRSGSWLNLSEYKSGVADSALEGGRTRDDPEIRKIKYRPFLEAWREDSPALALYQPRFLYISRGKVHNFEPKILNQAADRYNNVENWMVREAKTPSSE